MLQVAVDVQMVGVHCSDGGYGWMQLKETAVELVGLGHHYRILAHQQVGAVVLGDTAEEGTAAFAAFGKDMRHKRTGSGFAVGTGNRQTGLSLSDFAKHAAALDHPVTVAHNEPVFSQIAWDGGGIDHKCGLHVGGDARRVVVVVHCNSFGLEFCSEGRGGAVVTGHAESLERIVTGDGAHAYASDSEEVDMGVRLHFAASL